jgi:hypothetical protein
MAEMLKNVPGNIFNLPVRGEDVMPEIAGPAAIQATKVVGVYERLRDKLGEIGTGIKERLGGAFEAVYSIASRVGSGIASVFTNFGSLFVAGAGIGTAIDLAVGGMNDLVAAVNKLVPQAANIGITVQQLQRLQEWAREGGAPVDRVASSLANLNRVIGGVVEGAKGYDRAGEAFAKLNISLRDTDTGRIRTVAEVLPEIAAGLQGIADPAERAKVAYDLFAQTWKTTLPLLMQGPEALKNAEDASKAIGEISDAQIKAAQAYDKALTQFRASWQATRETIGAALLPAVTPALEELTKFVQANREGIGAGFKTGVEGLITVFEKLDAVVKSTNDDIQAIKAGWEWLHKPIEMPEWFAGRKESQAGGAVTSPGGGPLTPEDLAGARGGPIVGPATGTVNVIIDNRNAPPGQRVSATTTGQGVTADVGQSMPWSVPEYRGPYAPAAP